MHTARRRSDAQVRLILRGPDRADGRDPTCVFFPQFPCGLGNAAGMPGRLSQRPVAGQKSAPVRQDAYKVALLRPARTARPLLLPLHLQPFAPAPPTPSRAQSQICRGAIKASPAPTTSPSALVAGLAATRRLLRRTRMATTPLHPPPVFLT